MCINYRSVLSPADHPSVISVGSLRDSHHLLVGSSRGYRNHSIQRLVPEVVMLGYKVPITDANGRLTTASGTSIAAPIVAGIVALIRQWLTQEAILITPGLIRCVLANGRKKVGDWLFPNGGIRNPEIPSICAVPNRIEIPSEQFPFFLQPMLVKYSSIMSRGPGLTSHSFQLTVYSREMNQKFSTQVNCSWVHITHIDHSFPYATLFTIQLTPTTNQVCGIDINSLTIPIVSNDRFNYNQKVIRWFEKPVGDTLTSNGESAYTNYFRLYQSLVDHFTVDIVAINERMGEVEPTICICFSKCGTSCSRIIRILSEKRRIDEGEIRITPVFRTCSLRYKGRTLNRVGIQSVSK